MKLLKSGTLYFGEEHLGFSHKEVVTHSLWFGVSVELFLEIVYPETIMITGLWSSNLFFGCIQIQFSNLNKGISDIMVSTQAFYTIPKEEVI